MAKSSTTSSRSTRSITKATTPHTKPKRTPPEQVVMVRGAYEATRRHHPYLRKRGFKFCKAVDGWVAADMSDEELEKVERRVKSTEIEVRRVRKKWVAGEGE